MNDHSARICALSLLALVACGRTSGSSELSAASASSRLMEDPTSTSAQAPVAALSTVRVKASGPPMPSATSSAKPALFPELPCKPSGDAGGASECPLQARMKSVVAPAHSAGNYQVLGDEFVDLTRLAPPGYSNWTSIAKDGLRAARAEQAAGVEASCRGCHDQYLKRYQVEFRSRPLN